jgi:G3E family GTPase
VQTTESLLYPCKQGVVVLTIILHAFMQADMFLGNLLLEHSEDIYRMKGLLSVSGMPQRFVFQVHVNLCYNFILSSLEFFMFIYL